MTLLVRVAARLLPPHERDVVTGDLLEDGIRPGSIAHLTAVLGIAAHIHAEGWRDDRGRMAAMLSFALGLLVLHVVGTASQPFGEAVTFFSDPISTLAVRFWSAPGVASSLAAGLIVGHAPWVPEVAVQTRWHVAAALAVSSALATPGAPLLPAALLLGGAWLGAAAASDRRGVPTGG